MANHPCRPNPKALAVSLLHVVLLVVYLVVLTLPHFVHFVSASQLAAVSVLPMGNYPQLDCHIQVSALA